MSGQDAAVRSGATARDAASRSGATAQDAAGAAVPGTGAQDAAARSGATTRDAAGATGATAQDAAGAAGATAQDAAARSGATTRDAAGTATATHAAAVPGTGAQDAAARSHPVAQVDPLADLAVEHPLPLPGPGTSIAVGSRALPPQHPLVDGRTATAPLVLASRGHRPDTLPVWFMRQAGRSLPEYRAARAGIDMLDSCLRPELAAELTLQPVRRHGVDAAVFFSDIVVPLRLIGVDVSIEPGRGPVFAQPVRDAAGIAELRARVADALAGGAGSSGAVPGAAVSGGAALGGAALGGAALDETVSGETASGGTVPGAAHPNGAHRGDASPDRAPESGDAPSAGLPASTAVSGAAVSGTAVSGGAGDAFAPVRAAVALAVAELGTTPLIGFAGGPFTLAAYLVEGGPSKDHLRARALMRAEPAAWAELASILAELSAAFLAAQIEAGASVVQLFDSWAGSLSPELYRAHVAGHSGRILRAAGAYTAGSERVRSIHFGVGTARLLRDMHAAGGDVQGVDERIRLDEALALLGPVPVQGNIDPAALFAGEDALHAHVREVVAAGAAAPAHIVNLGHGVPPSTDPDVLTRLVDFVHALPAHPVPDTSAVPPESSIGTLQGTPQPPKPGETDEPNPATHQQSPAARPVPTTPAVPPESSTGTLQGTPQPPKPGETGESGLAARQQAPAAHPVPTTPAVPPESSTGTLQGASQPRKPGGTDESNPAARRQGLAARRQALAAGGSVTIVGAGVAGLVAARELARRGASVVVLEAQDAPGGFLKSAQLGGLRVDVGAEAFATRGGTVAAFLCELGLGDEIVTPRPLGSWAFDDGLAYRLPAGVLGVPTDPDAPGVFEAVGTEGVAAVRREARLDAGVGASAATLGEYVRARFGELVLRRLVAPVARGVYSRDPDDLPLAAVPQLPGHGILHHAPGTATTATPPTTPPATPTAPTAPNAAARATAATPGARVASLRGGMHCLVTALVVECERLGVEIRTGERVTAPPPAPSILTAPLPGLGDGAAHETEVVILRVAAPELDAYPRGTGVLVASGSRAKALTHISAKWPWVDLPPGEHIVRLSYNGPAPTDPEVDAEVLLGVPLRPLDEVRQVWRIPALTNPTLPAGVAAAGTWVAGTGLASVIPHAIDITSRKSPS